MKRFLIAAVFIVFLSISHVYAGHSVAGNVYCDCHTAGCLEDYPGECGGGGGPYAATQQSKTPSDSTAELGILIVALLFWLRLKA